MRSKATIQTAQFKLNLPVNLREAIEKIAAGERRSVSQQIIVILEAEVIRRDRTAVEDAA